jgi:hypothetical protein
MAAPAILAAKCARAEFVWDRLGDNRAHRFTVPRK